jgi:hypothetical protein
MVTVGCSVTVAVADLVPSAWLVARTVTVCVDAIDAGAVYSPPAVTVPVPVGLTLHVTAVFVVPVTVAVNCRVWLAASVAVVGLTDTTTVGCSALP